MIINNLLKGGVSSKITFLGCSLKSLNTSWKIRKKYIYIYKKKTPSPSCTMENSSKLLLYITWQGAYIWSSLKSHLKFQKTPILFKKVKGDKFTQVHKMLPAFFHKSKFYSQRSPQFIVVRGHIFWEVTELHKIPHYLTLCK